MADLTVDDLLRRVNQDPTLQAVFSGSKQIETVGNRHHIVPSAYTKTYGTETGSLTSVTGYRDGSAYKLVEVATNAIDVTFYFDNIVSFQSAFVSAKYSGTSSHWVNIQLWDGTTASTVPPTFNTVHIINHTPTDKSLTDMEARVIQVPNPHKFISPSRRVALRFLHGTGATPGHELWIDYLALVV